MRLGIYRIRGGDIIFLLPVNTGEGVDKLEPVVLLEEGTTMEEACNVIRTLRELTCNEVLHNT